MLTTEQIETFKNKLLEQQSELIHQIQTHRGLMTSQTDAVGELSSYDNHPGDMGTELFERGKDIALNEHTEMELAHINEALHAIDEGTYGLCKVCSADISFERLLALPTANTCIEHKEDSQATSKFSRPVEEQVYSPNINPDDVTEETQVGYDAEDTWQDISRVGTSETPADFYEDKHNYDDMYPNSDEHVSYVEEVEKFPSTNFD